jgi:hypothetical protein
MTIELTCGDNQKYKESVDVFALSFNTESKTFSMPYCAGDDWYQVLTCPLTMAPLSLSFQGGVAIHFERQDDADAFGKWLIEADKKVRHGFTTMRG